MISGTAGAMVAGDILEIGALQISAVLVIAIFVLTITLFYLMVHFIESQSPRIKDTLLDEARKDNCLDLEVKVVPMSENESVYMFRILSSIFIMLGIFLIFKAEIIFGLFAALFGSIIFYFISPFGRKARVVITAKLAILPCWMYRPLGLGTDIIRMENVERVVVKRKPSKRREIAGLIFKGKVHAAFRLSMKDSGKYNDILMYLRRSGIAVVDGD